MPTKCAFKPCISPNLNHSFRRNCSNMFSGPGCGDYPHHLNGFSGAGSGEFVFGDTPVAAPSSSSGHPRPASDYPSSSGGGAATPPTSVMLGSGPAWYHHHHHEDRDEVGANQQFESEHFFHEMGFEIAIIVVTHRLGRQKS